ncbi:chaperonin GroEL [Candidatus Kaiserbacteria bacterium CG10_big_fil_rev_8_21_14_0_10_45_20]|uniref:Chaperonin GroEL n=1 Tax=Candidatus Kaiserbacteria bacterium CG10_big_fil_rev_8_21_14_0_10_45_20 TaxID=1974607 RepID=A0A2H0UG64_9BACT|nr:MAG: chaperonin GroEL [Candidatus Kaiserbacteria bacterium CG10_big_fil_rev_8_21_14_0_10_45_20]
MAKKILFDTEARTAVKKGIDAAAKAVKVTLGPRGKNVIIDKGYGGPHMTNDGVTIAKEISFKDKFENMGAEIVKEVANKTNDLAGDGTTTATVLLEALIGEGMKHTQMGVNAMGVRAGMESALQATVKALKSMAKPVQGAKEIKQVATISAESAEIGETIAEIITEVGQNGVVTVEESQSFGIEKEVVKGMEFDKGYVSPYMITNPERMEAVYKDASVLITDKKISSIQEILPILEGIAKTGKKELVIIADDVDGEALATLVVNKLRGAFSVLAVKAPGYGDRKKEMLQDIATVVGATVVSEDVGLKLENTDPSMLGKATRIIATKDSTTVVGGKGKKADIDARVGYLQQQLDASDSKFDKEKLMERIAKLSGGVAVIRVGAATETEMKYLKDKIEDAVNATKAAIAEGIVPGGGSALVKVGQKVEKDTDWKKMTTEEAIGFRIVLTALNRPLKQIAINAGKDSGEVIVEEVRKGKSMCGYDAVNDIVVDDMIEAGIIDPVKVTRGGIEHAVSAAAILLTTEAAIADEPEEKPAPQGGGMPEMGY